MRKVWRTAPPGRPRRKRSQGAVIGLPQPRQERAVGGHGRAQRDLVPSDEVRALHRFPSDECGDIDGALGVEGLHRGHERRVMHQRLPGRRAGAAAYSGHQEVDAVDPGLPPQHQPARQQPAV